MTAKRRKPLAESLRWTAPLVGPWVNATTGRAHVRPEGAGALDFLGRSLEATQGDPLGPGTVNVSAADLRALGRALRRVASGEDARHVFAQTRAGYATFQRQRKGTIAYLYWRTLAEVLAAGAVSEGDAKRQAIARAQRQFPHSGIDGRTVTRYARALRVPIMQALDCFERSGQGPDLAALRAYLARHSRQGRWTD
jgi:hypothetical protein